MLRRTVTLLAVACTIGLSTTTVIAQTVSMQRASVSFRVAPGGGDDGFQLRALVPLPFAGFDFANEAFTLTIADADGAVYSASIPAGSFVRYGTRKLRYFDRTGTIVPGLHKVTVRRMGVSGVIVRAVGHNIDLGALDGADITTTFGFGQDDFAVTNHFRALSRELRFP